MTAARRWIPWICAYKGKVDLNLRSLVKAPRFRTTAYDPKSIMHYSFPAWMFLNGERSKCFVGHNVSISDLDKQAISMAYPDSPKGQMDYLRNRGDFAQQILSDLGLTNSQKARLSEVINKTAATAAPGLSISMSESNCSGGGITAAAVVSCTNTGGGSININQSGNITINSK